MAVAYVFSFAVEDSRPVTAPQPRPVSAAKPRAAPRPSANSGSASAATARTMVRAVTRVTTAAPTCVCSSYLASPSSRSDLDSLRRCPFPQKAAGPSDEASGCGGAKGNAWATKSFEKDGRKQAWMMREGVNGRAPVWQLVDVGGRATSEPLQARAQPTLPAPAEPPLRTPAREAAADRLVRAFSSQSRQARCESPHACFRGRRVSGD